MRRLIMGIDASLNNTGLCIVDENLKVIYSENIYKTDNTISKVKHHWMRVVSQQEEITQILLSKGSIDKTKRIVIISDRINKVAKQFKVTDVVMEGYSFGSVGNTIDLAELGGVIKTKLFKQGITEVSLPPPTTLKKAVAGKGNATKEDLQLVIEKDYGVFLDNEHLYDAFALCVWFLAQDKAAA